MKLIADPQLLYRSFLNILVNALQSMETGGAITVNVEEEDGYYLVAIVDNGSGISEEALEKSGLTQAEIETLKAQQKFIFVLDAFDEIHLLSAVMKSVQRLISVLFNTGNPILSEYLSALT